MSEDYKKSVEAWEKIQRMCIDAEERDIKSMKEDVKLKTNIIKEKEKYLILLKDTLESELKAVK